MQRSDTAPIEGRAGVGLAALVTEPAVWSCDPAEAEVYRGVKPTVAIDTDYNYNSVCCIVVFHQVKVIFKKENNFSSCWEDVNTPLLYCHYTVQGSSRRKIHKHTD